MRNLCLLMLSCYSFFINAQDRKNDPISQQGYVQSYKIKKPAGKLIINVGEAIIEGYSGDEIIFSVTEKDNLIDKRAEGLQSINGLGLVDNTGLGINVTENKGLMEVTAINIMAAKKIKILVPKSVIVSYKNQSQHSETVIFKYIQNEIEIATTYNDVKLENITGPVTARSIHGNIDAMFSSNVKGPISIISIYGHADVSLPKSIKADVRASTTYGEIYVSPQLQLAVATPNVKNPPQVINEVNGKINGGGQKIDIRSDHDKIYLRANH